MLILLFNLIDVNGDDKLINVFGSTFIILLQYIKKRITIILNPSKAVAKHSAKLSGFLSGIQSYTKHCNILLQIFILN